MRVTPLSTMRSDVAMRAHQRRGGAAASDAAGRRLGVGRVGQPEPRDARRLRLGVGGGVRGVGALLGAREHALLEVRRDSGELVALGVQEQYDASVIAIERCELYLVTRDDLTAALAADDDGGGFITFFEKII